MNVNARSLLNKFPSFISLVSTFSPHIVGVTESWLHEGVYDSEITPPGYVLVRNDRQNGKGGGVALLFRSDLKFSVLPVPLDIESVWCKLYLNKHHLMVGVCYRPPGTSDDHIRSLNSYIYNHNIDSSNIICMGDFNAPGIHWPSLTPSGREPGLGRELINFSLSHDLVQLVSDATRLDALLDLMFVSSTIAEAGFICETTEGISDHKAVIVTLSYPVLKTLYSFTTFPDFNRANDTSILDALADAFSLFESMSRNCDVDTLVTYFENVVKYCIHHFVPIKTKKTNKKLPWMNRDILHLSRRVRRLRRRKNPDKSDSMNEFQKAKKQLAAMMASAKDFFFGTQLHSLLKSNPRKFWTSVLPSSCSSSSFLINSETITDDQKISHAFNTYFHSVFSVDNHVTPAFNSPSDIGPISDVAISHAGVLNLVLNLDAKKGDGPDGIPNSFLIRYALWTSRYLTIVFQKCLSSGIFPGAWKLAKVRPIYKSGDKQLLPNYRPISLTSHSGKLLEHIIYKHIIDFLETNNVLSNLQHGFRRGFSTLTQLTEFTHDISSSLDCGHQVDVIFIDFAKAFDTVSHSKLLIKLGAILKNSSLIDLIANFLFNRSQYVSFNSGSSPLIKVTSGVPQGSVLGPLLFLIFINDLPQSITCKLRLYADDCVLYNTINSVQDHHLLNDSFSAFCSWCNSWQMNINFRKTVSMSFTTSTQTSVFNYSFNDLILQRVLHYKYLGVIFTTNLSWSKHINSVCTKSLKKLGYLSRTLRPSPQETKLLMYKTLIRPVLDYASTVWCPYKKGEIKQIESVQKKSNPFHLSTL